MAGGITQHAFSAPMAKVLLDGKEVGWATGVNIYERVTNIPVKPLGTVYVQEHCPTEVNVSVSVSAIHVKGDSLEKQGFFPQGSTTDIISKAEMSLELYDQITAEPVARVFGLKGAGRSAPLGRGGIMSREMSYDAIRWEMYAV